MNNTKVSVITVVYNGVATIERTINSVLAQTYPNIEYIIIDGQSTDGTLKVINRYRKQISHLISEPDNGVFDAMNKGIKLATGDLIGIINSDDWYEQDAVQIMINAYTQNPNFSIFHGLLRFVDKDGAMQQVLGNHHNFLNKGMIEHPTCFIHKSVYKKLQFDTDYSVVADYDFMLKAVQYGFKFYFIEQIIANFSYGGMSTSFKSAKETLALQKKYKLITNFKRHLLTTYFWFKLSK